MTENELAIINEGLENYLNIDAPVELLDSMRYSVFASGKRVRPLICLLSGKALGGKADDILPFACALELIHTYSLIHDDLPAMDDDDFRRGKPTNHKVFGEALAILAGDALLNRAYEIMAEAACKNGNPAGTLAMFEIAKSSGAMGMVGGQTVDVLSEGKKIDEKTLNYIHENKTAALIKAAMVSGATLSGASGEEIEAFGKAGYYLGMAFQIKDDLLDLESCLEVLGKPVGSDVKNKKNTYILIHGAEKAREDYLKFSSDCIYTLESLNLKNGDITEYIKILTNRIK